MFNNRYLKFLMLILTVFNIACNKNQSTTDGTQNILVQVGDKDITVNEFIQRAEYTIRPAYCRGENYIHKKIVLNSLIAEKLLALEAGEDNDLLRNKEFQNYLKGRKEQSMRQWYYYKEAVETVKVDSNEIKKEYKLAGRTYRISYFTLPKQFRKDKIKQRLKQNPTEFIAVFKDIAGEENIPEKEIRYGNPEKNMQVYNQLFLEPVQKGQIIGPLEMDDGSFFVACVNGWSEEVAFSDQQVQDRWHTVKENIINRKSLEIYEQKILGLMKGKKVEFNKEIFFAYVNIVGPEYYKTEEEKKQSFRKKVWNEDDNEMVIDDNFNQLKQVRNEAIFSIDGVNWTVRDLEVALQSHPLVFRKKQFPKNEFGEQLKLAIVDMVRDKYITEDAYKRGYDKEQYVTRNLQMWKDNLLALYQKQEYLKSVNCKTKDQFQTITKTLDPYVKQLHEKYNEYIKIDVEKFENIQLTKIDMLVTQQNVPFPIVVPGFPQLTTYNKLDYGKKM